MDKKKLLYVGIAIGIAYAVTDHMNKKVNDLRVVNVSADQASSEPISVQQFYPVISIDNSEGGSGRGNIDDAFFVAPPEPDPSEEDFIEEASIMEPLHTSLDVIVVEIPPLPEPVPAPDPIDPINFLAEFEHLFQVQATMPEQRSVIINGWAYRQGDKLPVEIPVTYEDEYGNVQQEQLQVTLSTVKRGSVLLIGETSEGWKQSLMLKL